MQYHKSLPAIKLVYPATTKRDVQHDAVDAAKMVQNVLFMQAATAATRSPPPSAQRYPLWNENYGGIR